MPEYFVYLLDAEDHITHCHTIIATSNDTIIRKVSSCIGAAPEWRYEWAIEQSDASCRRDVGDRFQ